LQPAQAPPLQLHSLIRLQALSLLGRTFRLAESNLVKLLIVVTPKGSVALQPEPTRVVARLGSLHVWNGGRSRAPFGAVAAKLDLIQAIILSKAKHVSQAMQDKSSHVSQTVAALALAWRIAAGFVYRLSTDDAGDAIPQRASGQPGRIACQLVLVLFHLTRNELKRTA